MAAIIAQRGAAEEPLRLNVVHDRPVRASSILELNRMPQFALDGNTAVGSRRWMSTETSPPHWLEIEIEGQVAVSGINYWTGSNSRYEFPITGFQLQYWDGIQWRGIHSESGYANDGVVAIDFPAVLVTDKLRFNITAATGNTARLYELQVMATEHPLRATEVLPADGSSVVEIDCPMRVGFNLPVEIVDAAKVRVMRQTDGAAASGIVVSKDGDRAISVGAELERETTYVLRLDAGAVATSGDPAVVNPPVYTVFRTAAQGPEVADYARTVDTAAPLRYTMDREIALLDANKIRLIQLPEQTAVDLTSVSVNGAELTLQHAGLSPQRHYALRLQSGALAGIFNGVANADILIGHYTGTYLTMEERSFENGWRQGFITNTSLGNEDRARAWSVFLNDQGAGPGYDFSFLGTNRTYDGDFAATPALSLEAGASYTLTFAYALTNADLRIDLRDAPVRNEALPRLATRRNTHGNAGVTNVTFDVEQNGDYHLVFYGEGDHWYPWLTLDNLSVVRAVPPGLLLSEPAQASSFNEGTPITISGSAFGVSAELSDIRIFSGERLLSTHASADFAYSWTDYDPGMQALRIVARDKRFQTTEITRDLTINFADGTLAPFINYAFRDGLAGVVTSGDWNAAATGFIDFRDNELWLSTPRVFLRAGETYTLQFRARNPESAPKTLFLSAETQPGYPSNPLQLAAWSIDGNTGDTVYATTFTVEQNAAFYMTLYNALSERTERLHIDDLRIIGNFNAAPSVNLLQPVSGLRTIAGAPIDLVASADDSDCAVDRVEFWNGNLLIGTVAEPPYAMRWESAPAGELMVTALAYDNAGGVSDPAEVSIEALPNRVNIATNTGTSANESVRGMLYQDDGTLVIAGNLDPYAFAQPFPDVVPVYLAGAQPGQHGTVVRLSEDGRTVLSVTVVGPALADIARDAAGNLYLAAGPSGLVKLNAAAERVVWHYTPTQLGNASKRVHRVDASPDGWVAAILSPQSKYGTQQLHEGEVAIVAADDTFLGLLPGSGGTYTTDVAVDSARQRVWIAGWKNFVTCGDPICSNVNPVDVPILIARSLASPDYGARVMRAWDWEANDDNGRWLNRLKNNMADTRTQRVTLAPNGDVYVGLEYDGGNTPLRDDPYDLSLSAEIVGGDLHHNNALTSTTPKIGIVRLDGNSGAYVTGQFLINRLSSGMDNTFRLEGGQLLVDAVGRVHVAGASAAGLPMSFDPLPGSYSGGGGHWVMSPDLSSRELVTRWGTSGTLHAIAVSPAGKIAVGGSVEASLDDAGNPLDRQYRRRAWLDARQGDSDGVLVVGDFAEYFSFQPGNHPRLFFTASDVPELRYRATQAPFASMVTALQAARLRNGDYENFDESHPYDRSLRAKIDGFLYVLTGDESYALSARADVEWVLENTTMPWASSALKGLNSYWMGSSVAMAYDWCASSPNWDDAFLFRVSKALVDMGQMIITHGGSEQNANPSSNWQGGRGSAGGLTLLATDARFDPALLDAAYSRVVTYLNASTGNHPQSRGWSVEGIGYTYYPYGLFVGPFGQAMARIDGRDLRADTPIAAGYQSLLTAAVAAANVYDYGGIKPDWSVDNLHIRGEGIYGQAFYYIDASLLPATKWIYDRLMGTAAPDRARWDDTRGGTIWSFLNYPADVIAQSPLEFYQWQRGGVDTDGIGISTFRNQYQDGSDLLAQFKVRRYVAGGHDTPDGLGFRIVGMGTAWAVGGGRNEPGKRIGQASLYRNNPADHQSGDFNLLPGTYVGNPLLKPDGGGHAIGFMSSNNQGVTAHKRWFVTDFDAAATGAQAAIIVADTSTDGSWWQMPTSPFNTVAVDGNSFTITSPDGATLHGTVLHPADAALSHGSRERGDAFALLNGGTLADFHPVDNPYVVTNKYVTVQSSGGDFLIAMTLQPGGADAPAHPAVSRISGGVADALVEVGVRQYTLKTDDVWYDGQPYAVADATIVFDAGDGQLEAGAAIQTVAYGGAPVAPQVSAPTGHVFTSWDRRFDAVTGDMTITALYTPVQHIPNAPGFLRGSVSSGGGVSLQWNDESIGETGFTVEESLDGGNSWSAIASLAAEETTYVAGARAPLTTYWYRVRAEGTSGPSTWSNALALTTPAANLAPVFVSHPPTHANQGAWFAYAIEVEDPEDDGISFALLEAPDWASLTITGNSTAMLTGIPDGSAAVTSFALSATDGTNTAVLQPFEVAVNTAPQLTLVTPTVLPVLLSAGHGLYAQVLAVDAHALSLEWAVVQGPEGALIAAHDAVATNIVFPRDGTYTVRITATDALGAVSQLEFSVLIDRPLPRTARDVVVFDDSHFAAGWSAARYRNSEGTYAAYQDVNGDGQNNGVRRHYVFSSHDGAGKWTTPLTPAGALGVRGATLYGGIMAERNETATSSLAFTADSGFTSSGRLKLRFQNEMQARLDAAIFWTAADFEGLAPGESAFLGTRARMAIGKVVTFDALGQVRWLVRAGDQFYVSERLVRNTDAERSFSGTALASGRWAAYHPAAPYAIDFDADAADFNLSSLELGAIQAIGLYLDSDNFNNRRASMEIGSFVFTAEVGTAGRSGPTITFASVTGVQSGQPIELEAAVAEYPAATGSTLAWTVLNGTGTLLFSDDTTSTTTATASAAGAYTVRLFANDGGIIAFRDLALDVLPSPIEAWALALCAGAFAGVSDTGRSRFGCETGTRARGARARRRARDRQCSPVR